MSRPPWRDSLSDGCSVPTIVQILRPDIAAACKACYDCCVRHDEAYYNGGSEADRLRADFQLFECMMKIIPGDLPLLFFGTVREFGGTHWGDGPWHGQPRVDTEAQAP